MTSWKKQVRAHGVPPGYGIQHPSKEFSEITSGSSRGQQGLRTTCQDSSNEAKCRTTITVAGRVAKLIVAAQLNAEAGESPTGVAHEPVGAMTEG